MSNRQDVTNEPKPFPSPQAVETAEKVFAYVSQCPEGAEHAKEATR